MKKVDMCIFIINNNLYIILKYDITLISNFMLMRDKGFNAWS